MILDTARLELYLLHRSALVNYASAVIGERSQAEDVVQDAFLRFSAHAGGELDQPLAYLYRIVRNLALDAIRRNAVESRQQQAPPIWMQPSKALTPEQSVLQADDVQRIAATFAQLTPSMRTAVEMHRLGGYTLQQIATHLDVSLATAHRLVRDAVVKLASSLTLDDEQAGKTSQEPPRWKK